MPFFFIIITILCVLFTSIKYIHIAVKQMPRTFSICNFEKCIPIKLYLSVLTSPQTLVASNLLFVSMNLTTLYTS
jgi:hypothetical protein